MTGLLLPVLFLAAPAPDVTISSLTKSVEEPGNKRQFRMVCGERYNERD